MAAPTAPISSIDPSEPAGPSEVPREEVRAQLARILESNEFRAARNRARFLEYVVVRTLEGEWDTLKEYTIGVEVFGRGNDFDPRSDGVVRTQAGLVRKHLELYYEVEGALDPIEIALPKGRYVPRFQRRTPLSSPERPAPPPPRRLAPIAMALLAVGAITATVLWSRASHGARPARMSASAETLYRPIWGPFLQPGASNMLAFGIPQFFTSAAGLWIRDVDVNAPAGVEGSAHLQEIDRLWGPLRPSEAYTGIGEAYGVHAVTRFFLGNGHDLHVLRSPSVSWETLNDHNVIFLTSGRFKTLAGQLSYPAEFVHTFDKAIRVRNVHPAPGEQAEYEADASGSERPGALLRDYAIISVWPGKMPGRRILVLSGAYTWGTQAAAEFVTDAGFLRTLNDRLAACQRQRGLAQHPEFFQVLLRVEGRDSQPTGVTYVTHHDLVRDEKTGGLVALDREATR
jgi:hypothetical protein